MATEILTKAQPVSIPAPSATMTYEEFLRRDGGEQHFEWVDGKAVPMAQISKEHSDVGGFLLTAIRAFVQARDLGAVHYDPFQMKTGPSLPGRAPDILFVAKANLPRLKRLYLEGPADLVVEIISEGSRSTDRGDKYYEYEEGGVPEYWLIDPQRKQAEFYLRGDDGIYRPATIGADGIYPSRALSSLWIKVEWLWQQPPPALLSVLKEWQLI